MGGATAYWHLVVLRMLVGAGESAFSPACSSMISDMFTPNRRGLALGIFNWGIYFGYGLSYAIGNFVTEADLLGMGWRWSYFISGGFGLVVVILMILIVREPLRESVTTTAEGCGDTHYLESRDGRRCSDASAVSSSDRVMGSQCHLKEGEGDPSCCSRLLEGESGLKQVFKSVLTTPLILLTIAASVRHTAGFTWAYNTQLYFTTYYPSYNLGIWITVISIVGGTLGVATGGFISDKLVKKLGLRARIYVLAGSQFIATPFAVGVLYFSPPIAFYSLLGSYLFAEMWFGVLFAVLLELIPVRVQSTSIALFLFVINNVGGSAPILIEPLRHGLSYHVALLIMYPGFYLISSALFLLASFFVPRDMKAV